MSVFVALVLVAAAERGAPLCPANANAPEPARVCLWEMHTYVEMPVCEPFAYTSDAHHGQSYEEQQLSMAKRRQVVDGIIPTLGCFCQQTGTWLEDRGWSGYWGKVDWNVPGSHFSLDVAHPYTSGRSEPCQPEGKLLAELPMHPICSWGVVRDLSSRYSTGLRLSDQGGKTAGKVLRPILGTAAKDTVQTLKTLWAVGKSVARGVVDSEADVRVAVAEGIDWNSLLNADCRNDRSSRDVLTPKCVGKVCWNFVRDFRDLWCSWWKTDALARNCDTRDGACCSSIADAHQLWLEAEGSQGSPRRLAELRLERYSRLLTATNFTWGSRTLERELTELLEEMADRVEAHRILDARIADALNEETFDQDALAFELKGKRELLGVLEGEFRAVDAGLGGVSATVNQEMNDRVEVEGSMWF